VRPEEEGIGSLDHLMEKGSCQKTAEEFDEQEDKTMNGAFHGSHTSCMNSGFNTECR
jgi:hypothetical protein